MHRIKLFCITKYCCAPCKIVLYHEKSLCIQLNIELCFALVGHRIEVIRSTNPAAGAAHENTSSSLPSLSKSDGNGKDNARKQ